VFVAENSGELNAFPRCLNEGIAVMMEPQYHKDYYMSFLRMRLKSHDFIPLADLIVAKDYPRDPEFLYAEGYALVEYLAQLKGIAQLSAIVKNVDASRKASNELLRISGFKSLEELESNWKTWLTSVKENDSKR